MSQSQQNKSKLELIQITDAALAHLKKIVDRECALGFRLSLKKAGCNGYMYIPDVVAEINQNDLEMNINNLRVFIDSHHLEKIHGTIIDLVTKNLGQQQIVFKNPYAKGECGCGESFNLD